MNNSGQQRRLWVLPGPSPLSPNTVPTDVEDILNTFLKTTNLKATSNYPPREPAPQFWPCYSQGPLSRKHRLVIVCTNTIHSQARVP